MLRFLNSNVYLANELTNDIPGDVWTTSYPACVNDYDAAGIYESSILHKFKYEDFQKNPRFILDKEEIMFSWDEMEGFLMSWYDSCVQRKAISNCVDRVQWIKNYKSCYLLLDAATDVYEGSMNYYDALAVADLQKYSRTANNVSYYVDLNKLNPVPEVSWMLEDYLKNGRKSVWSNYLTEYIRRNIKDMLYKQSIANRAHARRLDLGIHLDVEMTIDDVDFSKEEAVFYFDNPFSADFKTNYVHISDMCGEVDN